MNKINSIKTLISLNKFAADKPNDWYGGLDEPGKAKLFRDFTGNNPNFESQFKQLAPMTGQTDYSKWKSTDDPSAANQMDFIMARQGKLQEKGYEPMYQAINKMAPSAPVGASPDDGGGAIRGALAPIAAGAAGTAGGFLSGIASGAAGRPLIPGKGEAAAYGGAGAGAGGYIGNKIDDGRGAATGAAAGAAGAEMGRLPGVATGKVLRTGYRALGGGQGWGGIAESTGDLVNEAKKPVGRLADAALSARDRYKARVAGGSSPAGIESAGETAERLQPIAENIRPGSMLNLNASVIPGVGQRQLETAGNALQHHVGRVLEAGEQSLGATSPGLGLGVEQAIPAGAGGPAGQISQLMRGGSNIAGRYVPQAAKNVAGAIGEAAAPALGAIEAANPYVMGAQYLNTQGKTLAGALPTTGEGQAARANITRGLSQARGEAPPVMRQTSNGLQQYGGSASAGQYGTGQGNPALGGSYGSEANNELMRQALPAGQTSQDWLTNRAQQAGNNEAEYAANQSNYTAPGKMQLQAIARNVVPQDRAAKVQEDRDAAIRAGNARQQADEAGHARSRSRSMATNARMGFTE